MAPAPSDLDLIAKIIEGDRKSFTTFYNQFQPQVYRTAFGYFHNHADAEEVSQDVFVEAYRSAIKFNYNSSISTWLYRITVNKSLDKIRFQKSAKRFAFFSAILFDKDNKLEEIIPDGTNHGIDADAKESEKIIQRAVSKLAENQRTAFVLTQVEDLSGKETAEIMNISSKAVESLIQRAKANLRKELSKLYDDRRK